MVRRVTTAILMVAAFCLAVSILAFAQEGGEIEAEMKAYMEKIAPGPHHAPYAKAAGNWNVKSTFWMDPNGPPTETTGTSTFKVVMGGRFLEETTTAKMLGMDWVGKGVFGYDTGKQKHVGVWYDSMGTMIMYFEGDCDRTCSVVTTYSEFLDPMTESTKRMKTVSSLVDEDHYRNEMFDVAADGTETKMMVVEYTRAR